MRRRVVWLGVSLIGVFITLLAAGAALLLWGVPLLSRGGLTVAESLLAANVLAVGLILGVPLALQGWAGWRERPSRPFRPRRVGWLLLLFALSVGWGVWVSIADVLPAATLPLAHVATMALPSLIILALMGRVLRGAGGSWREVVLNVAGGGLVGTGVALVAEAVVVFLLVAAVAAVLMMTPEGAAQLTQLLDEMQDPAWLMEAENLVDFLLSPVVAASVLGIFTIPVPLIEETVKTLLVGAWSGWRRPRPERAFLWGVAAGAGFALFESLFNGSLGGGEAWGASAVARVGAAVMHCFTGGLMGWGWGQAWSARRPLRLFASYAAAVTLHGLWNGIAVGTAFLGALTLAYEGQTVLQGWISAGAVALTGLLGVLTVLGFVALLWIARRLAPAEVDLAENGVWDESAIS